MPFPHISGPWNALAKPVLRQNLFTLRSVISQYTLDKQKAPQALEDLISAGYLKQLPKDPITQQSDTWVPVQEDDTLSSTDQQEGGIDDVHSGSESYVQRRQRLQQLVAPLLSQRIKI